MKRNSRCALVAKENADRNISPSADGDKGSAPLTSQAFEKA